jgi:hypothetical protein
MSVYTKKVLRLCASEAQTDKHLPQSPVTGQFIFQPITSIEHRIHMSSSIDTTAGIVVMRCWPKKIFSVDKNQIFFSPQKVTGTGHKNISLA